MIIFSNGHINHGIDMTLSISYGPDPLAESHLGSRD